MRKSLFVVLGLVVIAAPVTARQLQTPTDWKWRTDTPAKAVAESKLPPDSFYFVTMAPGWHITMGPGGLLYPTGRTASGNFTLEAQIFLFPGDSQEEYGIFLGGRSIDGVTTPPEYVAFVARKDGQAGLVRAGANREVVGGWKPNDAVLAHPGGDSTVKNVLRVEVGATDVIYSANGKEIGRWPRATLQTDGAFGFRVGKGVNLHISTLDVTQRLAPVPIKK